MTIQEFSSEFDVQYNNIASNAAPGLDEYEKSVLLTRAQDELIKNYFNPKGNKYQEGFDASPKRQMDFSSLITSYQPSLATSNNVAKFDDRGVLYQMPLDVMFVLNEIAHCTVDGVERVVNIVPITVTEYLRMTAKPYKQPLKNQIWRLFQSVGSGVNYISELIPKYGASISNYKMRYVRNPSPIILTDLESLNVSIKGVTAATECELNPSIHPEILQRAVELAKAAYIGDAKSVIELGERSE